MNGQYAWSIMIGLVTLFITMFSKVMLVAALSPGELGHVLILMPFMVPVMLQSLTTRPFTSPSFGYLPKLPTLDIHSTKHENLDEAESNIWNGSGSFLQKEKENAATMIMSMYT